MEKVHANEEVFTQLLAVIERDNKHLHDQCLETAINYKVEWDRELGRRRKLGIKEPDPIPHPDHVVIDMQTGSVRIIGPMTKEEKAAWDLWRESHEHGIELVPGIGSDGVTFAPSPRSASYFNSEMIPGATEVRQTAPS